MEIRQIKNPRTPGNVARPIVVRNEERAIRLSFSEALELRRQLTGILYVNGVLSADGSVLAELNRSGATWSEQ
jgi:hypothetical protein